MTTISRTMPEECVKLFVCPKNASAVLGMLLVLDGSKLKAPTQVEEVVGSIDFVRYRDAERIRDICFVLLSYRYCLCVCMYVYVYV
jgi:hypothetical protein